MAYSYSNAKRRTTHRGAVYVVLSFRTDDVAFFFFATFRGDRKETSSAVSVPAGATDRLVCWAHPQCDVANFANARTPGAPHSGNCLGRRVSYIYRLYARPYTSAKNSGRKRVTVQCAVTLGTRRARKGACRTDGSFRNLQGECRRS